MDSNVKKTIESCERWAAFDPNIRSLMQDCITQLESCSDEITRLRKQINDLRNQKEDVSA